MPPSRGGYGNIGCKVGACCALMKAPPRSPFRRPRSRTDPIAKEEEEEGGDNGPDELTMTRAAEDAELSLLYSIPSPVV